MEVIMQQVCDCKNIYFFCLCFKDDTGAKRNKILIPVNCFPFHCICLVTARKGVGLVCADYHGPQYKVESSDSSQNDEETSSEYEDVSDKSIFKTEKVTIFLLFQRDSN